VPELAHLRIFILRYTNVLIIIIIIIAPVGWIGLKLHTVGLKSDETDNRTPGDRYATGHCLVVVYMRRTHDGTLARGVVQAMGQTMRHVKLPVVMAVGKMRNCGMRNAEGKMRNGMCGKLLWNGG